MTFDRRIYVSEDTPRAGMDAVQGYIRQPLESPRESDVFTKKREQSWKFVKFDTVNEMSLTEMKTELRRNGTVPPQMRLVSVGYRRPPLAGQQREQVPISTPDNPKIWTPRPLERDPTDWIPITTQDAFQELQTSRTIYQLCVELQHRNINEVADLLQNIHQRILNLETTF